MVKRNDLVVGTVYVIVGCTEIVKTRNRQKIY